MMPMLVRDKWAIRAITLQWHSRSVKGNNLLVSTSSQVSSRVTSSTAAFRTLSLAGDHGIMLRRRPWELRRSLVASLNWMLTNSPTRWHYRLHMETPYPRFVLGNFRMPRLWLTPLLLAKGRFAACWRRGALPGRYRFLKVRVVSTRHSLPEPISTC